MSYAKKKQQQNQQNLSESQQQDYSQSSTYSQKGNSRQRTHSKQSLSTGKSSQPHHLQNGKTNIPSFITQVDRNGKPQRFDDQDTSAEDESQVQKELTFFQKICQCLKFRKSSPLVELEDVDPEESKQAHPPSGTSPNNTMNTNKNAIQYSQQQQQQQQKQRGPLQTNTKRVMQPQDPKFKGKKSLVIDLDETLVHSSFTAVSNPDFTLEIRVQNMPFTVYVKKRPGCEFFLEELSKYYELIIYTASLSEYADPVMDIIDKNRVCSLRLFRENCTLYNGVFVKDMSLMCREIKDNSETSFMFQPENAVHIKSYFDDPKDRELYRLIPVLIFLSNSFDVRHVGNWWRSFESNDYIDYRDKRNRLQRLDKLKMIEELGDLRQIDLLQQQQARLNESSSLQNSQMCLKQPESQNISPKLSASEHQNKNEFQTKQEQRQQRKPKEAPKKGLVIQVPDQDEDICVAPRDSIAHAMESVRNQLLNPNASPMASSTARKNPGFKFNEYEDYKRSPSQKLSPEDPYNFKTQPDVIEEDSDSYKEMKQIFDNIRYSMNNQNINSPVSKQRFVQILHTNSHRKFTEKTAASTSTTNTNNDSEQPHFFTSKKKQLTTSIVQEAQSHRPLKATDELPEQEDQNQNEDFDQLEITNKDSDELAIIAQADEFEDEDEDNSRSNKQIDNSNPSPSLEPIAEV